MKRLTLVAAISICVFASTASFSYDVCPLSGGQDYISLVNQNGSWYYQGFSMYNHNVFISKPFSQKPSPEMDPGSLSRVMIVRHSGQVVCQYTAGSWGTQLLSLYEQPIKSAKPPEEKPYSNGWYVDADAGNYICNNKTGMMEAEVCFFKYL